MAEQPRDPHKLCVACGLCCNGAWFGRGELGPDELEPARAAGLRVRSVDGGHHFGQPCTGFLNGCCSIYATWRPRVCGAYTCALLDRYMAGEVGEAEAMGHIASVKVMHQRVIAEVGVLEDGLSGGSFMRRLGSSTEGGSSAHPPLSPTATMDVVALKVYFNRHFKHPEKEAAGVTVADTAPPEHGT